MANLIIKMKSGEDIVLKNLKNINSPDNSINVENFNKVFLYDNNLMTFISEKEIFSTQSIAIEYLRLIN